jgi:hypothetical protein
MTGAQQRRDRHKRKHSQSEEKLLVHAGVLFAYPEVRLEAAAPQSGRDKQRRPNNYPLAQVAFWLFDLDQSLCDDFAVNILLLTTSQT